MPINQPRLRALTPEAIRTTARDLPPKEIQRWFTEIEGKRLPVVQLIRTASDHLIIDAPRVIGPTAHEAVAVLSHNGFTSHNIEWD